MDVLRFVDSIQQSPVVRLDLNDGTTWGANYNGSDFSPPPLKSSYASTMLADGERLTASAYANRTITLALDLIKSTQDASAEELQKLWRELNRPFNFLMWQPDGASKPVFFRTIRSSNTTVTDYPSGALRTVEVSIVAEPFAYGLKEQLASVLVYNDPSQGATLNKNPNFPAELGTTYWTAPGGTIVRSTAQSHEGGASLLLTPDGVTATVEARSETITGVVVGQKFRVSAWVRCAVARSVNANIVWRDALGNFVSSAPTPVSVAAGTWTPIDTIDTAPASAAQAQISVSMESTPPASNTLHIDEARIYVCNSAAEASSATPLNANSTFETGVAPWTALNGTIAQSSTVAGGLSCMFTPTGGVSPAGPRSENIIPVTPEVTYTASAWINSPLGFATASIAIEWLTSGGTVIRTDASSSVGLTAQLWRKFTATFRAPVNATQARMVPRLTGTITAIDVFFVDDARFHRAGTEGGMAFDILNPKGDVETPLYLSVDSSVLNTSTAGPYTSLVAVRRRGEPSNVPLVLEAEDMTRQANTTLASGVQTWSSNGYTTTTMTGIDSFTTTLSKWPFPPATTVDVRGTYRVFMRYRYATSGTVDSTTVRLAWGRPGASTSELITNRQVTLEHDGTKIGYADLGLVQIPSGYDPVHDGISGVPLPVEGIYARLQVKAENSVYSGLDVDCFLFVPADDRMLYVRWPVTDDPTPPADIIVDAYAGDIYARGSTGGYITPAVSTLPGGALSGGPPLVTPGVTNRIYFVRDVGTLTTTGDTVGKTTTITAHYWPRYLTVRGSAS